MVKARLFIPNKVPIRGISLTMPSFICLLYTSDAADERSSVDLGGRRIIKKKKRKKQKKKKTHKTKNIKKTKKK